jgi:hypothetical protein
VSPADTNGRELGVIGAVRSTIPADLFPLELGTSQGDGFVYMSYAGALDEVPPGNGVYDVYGTKRSVSGWSTTARLSRPPSLVTTWPIPGGFSADQGYAFNNEEQPGGLVDYLREPDGSFELTGLGTLAEEPFAQGRYISENGEHVVFSTGSKNNQSVWCSHSSDHCSVLKLETNAPSDGTGAVYDRSADGSTHVISLLPGNKTPEEGEQAFYKGASKDASSVAFQIGAESSEEKVEGTLYVRADNGLETERTDEVTSGKSAYAGLSDDGRYLFYVAGGERGTIHRFDTATEADVEVNPTAIGEVVNVSADGSHVYFICEEEIGGEGEEGKPNLFVWSGGLPEYVVTVLASDLVRTSGSQNGLPALTNWTDWATEPRTGREQGPGADSSRTTRDGRFLVFESRAQLTPYDNDEHTEIYRWDDTAKGLSCVSCNPRAGQATADARLQEVFLVGPPFVIHNISEDGSHVFFETREALVDDDINGVNDVYSWEKDAGEPFALISSGKSPEYPLLPVFQPKPPVLPNLLMSITPDGSDVFFTAQEALTPAAGENGTQAIYDARVDGGFPAVAAPEACAEEACKPALAGSASSFLTPSSEAVTGSGNAKPAAKHCRRSKGTKGKRHRRCAHRKRGARVSSTANTSGTSGAAVDGQGALPKSGSQEAPRAVPAALSASAAVSEKQFAIERFEAHLCAQKPPCGALSQRAGMHPDFTTSFEFTHTEIAGSEQASAAVEDITFTLPPGLLGNPAAVRACSMGAFQAVGNCPADSQVGVTGVKLGEPSNHFVTEPIYNLTPPHPQQEVARFGFIAFFYPVFIDIKVRTAGDYGVTATVHDAPGLGSIIRAKTTLWAAPASKSHDTERLNPEEALTCKAGVPCKSPDRPTTIPLGERKAFMTNPSACQEGTVDLRVTTYQLPGQVFSTPAPLDPITDCTGLPFAPTFSADPTSLVAGAPTGLKTKLTIPQHLGEEERATATMREARVTLPEGMQIAAGAANWIGTCSDAQVGFHKEIDTACPDNSKLGTATIISPDLPEPIEGTIYQRDPTPGHQFGLWLTADALGLHIKLPGELEPDKATGRLTAVFRDLPQVPVEEIDLDVWGGPRAPLQNPDHCGTYTTDFSFSPHSDDPAASGQSQMQITQGCGQGFSPALHAGVTDPVAGRFSPFVFDLTRPDGNQALRGFEVHLPDGELAKLAGVPLCPDAAATSGSCPADSRIGSLQAITGPGPDPLAIPQPGKAQPQIYLSGPYQGAPFSIVSEVPAQAGPFDLGTLAVRSGLQVDPETARATVKADPLPQFFEGVGIAYRHLHAVVDRPGFSLNPTDCREAAVTSDVTSTQGTVAHPSARFQVDGCKALKFKPRLSLKLKGGTRRADYPALTAVLKARKGDANIAFTSVALPHSEFLAQEHIGTVCTRVQFAADKCPKRSVYGKAKATTPLLDKPLEGPVYLRSSDHPLPDLVVALRGQLEIDLVGRIDSVNGGIRTTFDSVPDAPVSRFVLQMKGGAKGLLVNSTDICRGSHKASVAMRAQNGRAKNSRPLIAASGCGKPAGRHQHHR